MSSKIHSLVPLQQQEQDPTNLYIANLPPNYKESDVDNLLAKYGQVISTRILRDSMGSSKGVGFARMESKEKCEQIIQIFNGSTLPGSKEALLVKFADGGNKKKNMYKNNDNTKLWRDSTETIGAVGYDPNTLAQNGVAAQHMMPTISNYGRPYGQVSENQGCMCCLFNLLSTLCVLVKCRMSYSTLCGKPYSIIDDRLHPAVLGAPNFWPLSQKFI